MLVEDLIVLLQKHNPKDEIMVDGKSEIVIEPDDKDRVFGLIGIP